jgi:hypothetical protein
MAKTVLSALFGGLVVMAAVAAGASDREAPSLGEFYPDRSAGEVDGQAAWMAVPAVIEGKRVTTVDPQGFLVHLVRCPDLCEEQTHRAGVWTLPGPGLYRAWVERDGEISPYPAQFSYGGGPFRGSGMPVLVATGVAGVIELGSGVRAGEKTAVWLLHADSPAAEGFPRQEMARCERGAAPGDLLQMPEGTTIGALWDRDRRTFTAVSRSIEVEAGRTATLSFAPTASQSHLLVALEREPWARSFEDYEVDLRLEGQERHFEPDLLLPSAGRLWAVWYDLEPGKARLTSHSAGFALEPLDIELRTDEVAYEKGVLEAIGPQSRW